MSKGRIILSLAMVVITGYLAISSTQRLFESNEEVRIAEEELKKAQAEYEQSQEDLDRVLCEAPGMSLEPMCAKFQN